MQCVAQSSRNHSGSDDVRDWKNQSNSAALDSRVVGCNGINQTRGQGEHESKKVTLSQTM
eukprot:1058564-Amphidinium_carterae.1